MRERFPELSATLNTEAEDRLRKSVALAMRLSKDLATGIKRWTAKCELGSIDDHIELCQAAVDTRRKTEKVLKLVETNIAGYGFDLKTTQNECGEKTVITPEVLKCMDNNLTNATTMWELQTMELYLKQSVGGVLKGIFEKTFAGAMRSGGADEVRKSTSEKLRGLDRKTFTKVAQECRESELEDFYKLMELLRSQILSAEKLSGRCAEKPRSQCPEGTEPMLNPRFDAVAAAKYGSLAFPLAHAFYFGFFLGVVPALTAADVFVSGGTLSMAVAALGPAYLTMVPIYLMDWSSWTTAAVSIWMGSSYDCACYPRQCHYDASKQKCALESNEATQLKNKYSALLPFQGWKCTHRVEKGTNLCDEMPCDPLDLEGVQPNDKRYAGKLGIHGKSLYNCLKLTDKKDSRRNSLASSYTLADKEPNNAENRAKLFDKLTTTV